MGSLADTDTRYTTGVVLAVTEKSAGEYQVDQVEGQDRVPKVPEGLDTIIPFSYSLGPVTALTVGASILGISIGSFTGNLKDGLRIGVNLKVVSGFIRLYLKNGNEVWLQIELKALFKTWSYDQKIVTI